MDRTGILVTGGAGYIGRHLCKMLHDRGQRFVILDSFINSDEALIPDGWAYIKGDIRDSGLVADVCARFNVAACFHLAGLSIVSESVAEPFRYMDFNLNGTAKLIDGLTEAGVDRIIFSSSCAVYGDPLYLPIDEVHPTVPMSPYGESKLAAEKLLEGTNLRVGILRYFNAAGGKLGEFHYPETHLIPKVIAALIAGRDIEVYGSTYPTYDGTAIRDYVHVDDIARAHLMALAYIGLNPGTHTWNIGTSSGMSVMSIISLASDIMDGKFSVRFLPGRPGDPPMLTADFRKAYRELGWEPTLGIGSMLRDAISLYKT